MDFNTLKIFGKVMNRLSKYIFQNLKLNDAVSKNMPPLFG